MKREQEKKKETGTCLRRKVQPVDLAPLAPCSSLAFRTLSCIWGTKTCVITTRREGWGISATDSFIIPIKDKSPHHNSRTCFVFFDSSNCFIYFFNLQISFFLVSSSEMLSIWRIVSHIKVLSSWARSGWCISRCFKEKMDKHTQKYYTSTFLRVSYFTMGILGRNNVFKPYQQTHVLWTVHSKCMISWCLLPLVSPTGDSVTLYLIHLLEALWSKLNIKVQLRLLANLKHESPKYICLVNWCESSLVLADFRESERKCFQIFLLFSIKY